MGFLGVRLQTQVLQGAQLAFSTRRPLLRASVSPSVALDCLVMGEVATFSFQLLQPL